MLNGLLHKAFDLEFCTCHLPASFQRVILTGQDMVKIYRDGFSVVWSGAECPPVVNIIFIHGLRGHPRETWENPAAHPQNADGGTATATKTHGFRAFFGTKTKQRELPHDEASTRAQETIFWIQDFLPQDIPDARILTYGYNADVIGGLFVANNKNSISQHGRDLKAKLERDLDNEAPIIFVAHSLGGIIAKDALHRSKSTRERTKLIVFLGTPHRGSSSADWGQIASNMARLALQDSNKKILETLEVNNEVLDNIQEAFKIIVHEDGLMVHSFQEARGISGMKGLHNKVVDDFSSKVDLPSVQETVETIDANHMQMTKYSSKDDPGYRDVSRVLKTFIERQLKTRQVVLADTPPSSLNTPPNSTAAPQTLNAYFMVPFQKNGDLIGRKEYIQSLETKLCVPNEYCRVALVGLGGIGKTRIALEYVSKHKKSDSVSVFWVHAGTAERMKKAYQEIAKEARLVGAEDPNVDQLQLVKQWLEEENSGSWVMIIDNADDENLFFGEEENRHGPFNCSNKLAQFFPRRPNGSILLTTRNKRLGVKFAGSKLTTVGGVISIPAMSVSESKNLLLERIEEDKYGDDDSDLTDLVEILENLPLALVQAASFIAENSLSIAEYLRIYLGSDSSKIKLLSQNFEDNERDPDIKNPVAVTWAISFEQIGKNDPQAAELLSIMSVLDRQAIPKSLLSSDKDEVELETALGTLKAFSLITPEKNGQTFNLHRLVYLATRNWLNLKKELDSWTGKTLILLSRLFPTYPEVSNQELRNAYLPHARIVLNSDQLPATESIAQAELLYSVSRALIQTGDFDTAEIMARKSLDLREKALGEKNLETLCSLSNLGFVLWQQGKLQKAEEITLQTMNGFEEKVGKDHHDTLMCLNNLGLILSDQGKYEAAEILHQRVLSVKEKTLGADHLDTLMSLNNLGNVLYNRGKYKEAEKLHRRVLSAREKLLGKLHPETLNSLSNLGSALMEQDKYEEAEKLHRQAHKAKKKILGTEHRDTLKGIIILGNVLHYQKRYEEAEDFYRQAQSTSVKLLGKEHPVTLESIGYMAILLHNQGRYEEAEKLHRRSLSGREKMLGKEHPETLHSMQSLAGLLSDQGNYEEAEKLQRQALSGRDNVLGNEHPATLYSVDRLAFVLQSQDQYEEAEELNRRALSIREQILGKEDPDTLQSVNTLAVVLGAQGKYEEAERLHRRALGGRENVLGIEHPATLQSVNDLSVVLHEQNQFEEAEELSQRALSGREKILGKEHPSTVQSINNLAIMLLRKERLEGVEMGDSGSSSAVSSRRSSHERSRYRT